MQIDAAIRDNSKHALIFQAWQDIAAVVLRLSDKANPIQPSSAAPTQPTGLHEFDMNYPAMKGSEMAVTWS